MCGICGFTSKIGNQKKHISEMLLPLKTRGPDAEGTFFNENMIETNITFSEKNKK